MIIVYSRKWKNIQYSTKMGSYTKKEKGAKIFMRTFEEIFEELARYNDRSVIWNDWLDYVIRINLLYCNEEPPNYHGNEEAYQDLLGAYLNKLSEILNTEPYYDLLGELYEQVVLSQGKSKQLGQYYSPTCVAEVTTDLVMRDKTFEDNSDKIANDCACGSGRMLLATHVKSKGDLFLVGQDIDETSVKMCTINFWSMGARGSVMQMDSLEQTFYQGWRVNKYLYHGIPVPHIEKIHSPKEALDFIELYGNNNDERIVAKSTVKPSGQTTLI